MQRCPASLVIRFKFWKITIWLKFYFMFTNFKVQIAMQVLVQSHLCRFTDYQKCEWNGDGVRKFKQNFFSFKSNYNYQLFSTKICIINLQNIFTILSINLIRSDYRFNKDFLLFNFIWYLGIFLQEFTLADFNTCKLLWIDKSRFIFILRDNFFLLLLKLQLNFRIRP
jgi:hypothetical protein